MRGLLEAVLLLASVLVRDAGAVSHQENVPSSAFITIKLPAAQLNDGNPYLNFRFDVLESSEACGFVNATVNGRPLPTDGSVELQLNPETGEAGSSAQGVITGNWSSDCLTSDDKTREQRLQLRVSALDGVALTRDGPDDSDLIIRFRQTAPVRIIDIEGAASAFRFNEAPALVGNSNSPDAAAELDAAELAAWQQSLAAMHQHALLIQHDIRAREQYMRQRFGASSVKLACSDRSFLGALFHRITSLIGKSSWEDAGIRVQDSTGSNSWEQLYPPHEPPVCSSNNSRAGPPPPPPPPPPFLLRCAAPTTPSEEEAHNDPGQDHDENSGSEEEFYPPGENAGLDEEAEASRHGTWPGYQKSHTHNYRGMFAYIIMIAAISSLIMCSVHHFRDRMHDWHGHGRDVEEGGSDSGGIFRNRNRWRRANFRRRMTERWHSFTRRHRERLERGRASRQTRQQVRREDRGDRMSVGAKILYFLKRILSGRGRDKEKLLGRSLRRQNQQPGTARGHIEAVVVPPPSSPRESFSEQREEQPDEQQRLLQEAERQQQQQQRDEQQMQRQQQQQQQQLLQIQLQQQHQQILQQQQLQQQIQHQRRERQVREQQLQEQEQQRQRQRQLQQQQQQQPLLQQQLQQPHPQPHPQPQPQPQKQQKQQPEQYAKKQQADSQTASADHDRTPSPTMEQEIASFRAAADVVDQIIAAEEGRLSVAQTAKLKRQREQQQILASLSRSSPAAPRPSPSSVPFRQPPPPPPPPPSTVSPLSPPGIVATTTTTTTSTSTSRTPYGYDRRDLSGIDFSDFDDTESLPPAYSETGFAEEPFAAPGSMTAPAGFAESAYSYVDLAEAEASMVADGFQYRPGGNSY